MRHKLAIAAVLLSCAAAALILPGVPSLSESPIASGAATVRITTAGLLPRAVSVTAGEPVIWINQTEARVNLVSGELFRSYLPLIAWGPRHGGEDLGAEGRPPRQTSEDFGAVLEPGRLYTHTFQALGRHPYHVSSSDPSLVLAGEVQVEEAPTPGPKPTPEWFTYEVVHTYPHDPTAFTQGLAFHDGHLYEGTGLYGASSLRRVDLETGEVLQIHQLPDDYFGEGVAIYDEDKIAQLTWKSGTGFIYDQESFDLLRTFEYATEGWGLTYDGQRLIMSDGTATLHLLDPDTLEEVDTLQVRGSHGPVRRLNELEVVKGQLYANVWYSDVIAVIDLETGQVTAWVDLEGLLSPAEAEEADVLNGIAYDASSDRLFVTGKLWPTLFEIRIVPDD
jgi:glutamine cyclotransferase/plastocyanin